MYVYIRPTHLFKTKVGRQKQDREREREEERAKEKERERERERDRQNDRVRDFCTANYELRLRVVDVTSIFKIQPTVHWASIKARSSEASISDLRRPQITHIGSLLPHLLIGSSRLKHGQL